MNWMHLTRVAESLLGQAHTDHQSLTKENRSRKIHWLIGHIINTYAEYVADPAWLFVSAGLVRTDKKVRSQSGTRRKRIPV